MESRLRLKACYSVVDSPIVRAGRNPALSFMKLKITLDPHMPGQRWKDKVSFMGLLENKKRIFFTIYEALAEADQDGRYIKYQTLTHEELEASYKTQTGYKKMVESAGEGYANWLIFKMAFTTLFYVKYGPDGVERAWSAVRPRLKRIFRKIEQNRPPT